MSQKILFSKSTYNYNFHQTKMIDFYFPDRMSLKTTVLLYVLILIFFEILLVEADFTL